MSPPTLIYFPPRHTHKSFSYVDASAAIVIASFVSHLIFRFFEPQSAPSRIALLVVTPAFLSLPVVYAGQPLYAAIPLAFTTYVCALLLFTLTYRLSPYHPLAKFPGPVIAKTSKWWGAYINSRGDLHRYYKSLHDRYGDVVRIGPNDLSVNDASLIHPILGQGGLSKGPRWEGRPGNPSLLGQRDPVKHMHQRKPWSRALSSTALTEYEVIVANRTRQLLSCIANLVHRSARKEGALLDIVAWLNYFATDFMGDMAFGGGFELMNAGGDKDGIWALLHAGLYGSAILAHVTWIVPILWAITGKNGTAQRNRAFSRECVLKRLAMGPNRKDLFYYLSGEELSESERPSVANVARDGMVAIIAGSDTTSSVLAAIFYYLLLNPEAYAHLQEEVDSAFATGEEPLDILKLSQMEWLNGCINEGLRLQPPVPSGSQRSVNKGDGPKVLGKLVVPEQTQLTLHTYSIHRDARNFYEPDAFLPERWFSRKGTTDAPAGEHNMNAFIPFSYGPTNCVGKNLAWMQMRIVLCWMLQRFHFSKVPGVDYETWERRVQDWYVVHCAPLVVSVSLRE